MVVLGLILLIIGLVASIPVLTTIGAILLVVGIVLNLVPIGGTRRRVFLQPVSNSTPRRNASTFSVGISQGRRCSSPPAR